MNEKKDNSLDILGIKPIASAIEKSVDATISGASAFLSRICLPAAEEFGLMTKDTVAGWRAENAANIAARAEARLQEQDNDVDTLVGNTRVVCSALQNGSWIDDPVVQDFWAGLLASACDSDGRDDSNIVFISVLSQLSIGQVRLLKYAAENSIKYRDAAGWPYAKELKVELDDLKTIFQSDDVHLIDVSLDHLRTMELIGSGGMQGGGGIQEGTRIAKIQLSGLALNMYVRGEGCSRNPIEFWDLQPLPKKAEPKAPNAKPESAT